MRHCEKGIVISASNLLSEFQVSEHITCMDSKFCEQNSKHVTAITFSSKPNA